MFSVIIPVHFLPCIAICEYKNIKTDVLGVSDFNKQQINSNCLLIHEL